MFATLLTITVCMYWGASQGQYVGLMREIFGRDTVFRVKIVGAFKTETRRGRDWDLTTRTHELYGVNLTLTFAISIGGTTEMRSRDRKDLHEIWLTVCFLIGRNSDLHDVLRSNWYTGLSSGAKFLDIGRTVFEKVVTVVVLEICLTDNGWYFQCHRNPQCFCV